MDAAVDVDAVLMRVKLEINESLVTTEFVLDLSGRISAIDRAVMELFLEWEAVIAGGVGGGAGTGRGEFIEPARSWEINP